MWEELVLGELGLLQDVLHGTKVGLNLVLDVLVHAQLGLGLLAALCEHLDLAELDGAEGITGDNGVVGDVSRQVGGHLVANVKQVLVLVLEPLAGHGVLLGVLFMACTSMLLLASRTFNSLMTQVMLPILASMWCFCSASFSTSLSPRSRLSPAALLKRMELNMFLN